MFKDSPLWDGPLWDGPRPAVLLGLAGLIPFYAMVIGAWTLAFPVNLWILDLQLYYGAVVLSFLGAVHWGRALADNPREMEGSSGWNRLGWSVMPALIAWLALIAPQVLGIAILILGFGAAYLADHLAARRGGFPPWYLSLRRVFTLGAVLALGLGTARFAVLGLL